jgi:hypothetical protein
MNTEAVDSRELDLAYLKDIEKELQGNLASEKKLNRPAMLKWLRTKVHDENSSLSIADLIILAEKEDVSREVAAMLLRIISSRALPEIESNNEVARAVVSMAEKGQAELYAFLRIDPKAQTFKKIQAIVLAHDEICRILSPMRNDFFDIESALSARKPILGALNHSIVQKYNAAFDLKVVKATIEDLFHNLKLVNEAGPTLLDDVENFKKSIKSAYQIGEDGGSFLVADFLMPLIVCFEKSLELFLRASRNKFTTMIKARFGSDLQKRFPLHEPSRMLQISIPFVNEGPGLATSMLVTVAKESDSILLHNKTIHLGNVPPGDFSIVLDAQVIDPASQVNLTLLLEWGEIGEAQRKSEAYEVIVKAQKSDVDWAAKEYWRPYSTEPAQGDDFIGRLEKLRMLSAKLLTAPMESFYITGQKRVGKTSLALAAIEFAINHSQGSDLYSSYNLWGSFAHENPRKSLEALGKSIETLLRSAVPKLEALKNLDFTGSLSALVKFSEMAFEFSPEKKYVIVIDEFDEIHQELYLQGNLAETFFANLRAISRCKNMCLILIGGENMPYVMERQGQKLNNFSRVNLSYYDRDREWADFRLMIQRPTDGVINWHEDAIGEVFNIANGNPYFAKIVCASALEIAVQSRDTDISVEEIRFSNNSTVFQLGSNSFSHLWQDGVPKPPLEREPEVLVRTRVAVALARCYIRADPPTLQNIFSNRSSSTLSESEAAAALRDYVRRDVLSEKNGLYEFKLPIFEKWLVDFGAAQLAADKLTEDLANAFLSEDLKFAVRSDEVALLVKEWPTYRGRHVGADDVRAWISQVESAKEQRLLFEIVKRVRIFNESKIREMLRNSFSFLQPLPEFVIRRKSDRRRNILVTYVDSEGKSGASYASMFAEENLISAECIFPPGEFEKRISAHLSDGGIVSSIVIIDDLVATGKSILSNIQKFMEKNRNSIRDEMPVRVISIVSTPTGQRHVLDGFQKLLHSNIDFRSCELLGNELFAFSPESRAWLADDDFDRAKALCEDIGKKIYKSNPLGYGELGLLLVFPTNTPNNTLPILHTSSRPGERSWRPLFERITH